MENKKDNRWVNILPTRPEATFRIFLNESEL